MQAIDLIGYLAAAASLVSFSAKTMIPLRIAAIVSNVLFVTYGIAGLHGPAILLHLTLLPLNIQRLLAMKRLIRRVEEASQTHTFDAAWLRPYMKRKSFPAGTVMFRKGDKADEVYYLLTGRIAFPEVGRSVEGGLLFGEIAMFTPEGTRTLSCVCETDVEVLFIRNHELEQLYFQNPQFGFQLVRLIVGRLTGQIARLEQDLATAQKGEAVAAGS